MFCRLFIAYTARCRVRPKRWHGCWYCTLQTSDWNGGRNKRLDLQSRTLQTDTASDEVQSNAPNVNVASELQGILPTP